MKYLSIFPFLPGISLAYVAIVTDFDNGNLEYPVACSVFVANATASASAESGGMGSLSLHAKYNLGSPSGYFYLRGSFSPGLFRGRGLFFYARGRGIWDIGAVVLGAKTPAYYRLALLDDWEAYYIPWRDFFYAPAESVRPDLDTNLLVIISFTPQERQGGQGGEIWIDSLGYYYSEGPQPWDYDGDGIPDARDPDADSDRWPQTLEAIAGTDPLDSLSRPTGELGIPDGCYFGLFPILGLTDEQMVFSDITGLKPALVTVFTNGWGDSTSFYHFDRTACDFVARQGAIPVYQWPMRRYPPRVPGGWEWLGNYLLENRFSPESVAAGVYDAELAIFAGEVRDWGLPVFINPFVEYNAGLVQYSGLANFGPDASDVPPKDSMGVFGIWFGDTLIDLCGAVPGDSMCNYYGDPSIPDGPERVADALARIQSVFATAGADKVIWTLQAQPEFVPDSVWGRWNKPAYYYPQGHYPPWHASSAHHGMIKGPNDTVRLTEILSDAYDTLLSISQLPILLIEFAVHTDSATGSMDMSFMFSEDFCDLLKNRYPYVKGFTYANSDAYGMDYRHVGLQIDSARAQAFPGEPAAFSSCIGADPYYYQDPLLTVLGTNEWPYKKETPLTARPNPFSGRTVITCPRDAVQVSVYDPAGRLLWRRERPGREITWPEEPVAPGIYFVVAETRRGIAGILKIVRTGN